MKYNSILSLQLYFFVIIALLVQFILCIQLKENSLINGDFIEPDTNSIGGFHFYNKSIPGWTCRYICEIDNCVVVQKKYPNMLNNCSSFAIDLNSQVKHETITQIVRTSFGSFILAFNYYYPYSNPKLKTLYVYFNNELIFKINPKATNTSKLYFEKEVKTNEGDNNLTFTQSGYVSDGQGFLLTSLSLRRITNLLTEQLLNSTINNELLTNAIAVPSLRVMLGELINFFMNFDRLQFYSYHHRNNSYYFTIFLENVNSLLEQKGMIVRDELSTLLSEEEKFIDALDYKTQYRSLASGKWVRISEGLLSNVKGLIVYSLPITIAFYLFFVLLFHLSKSYRFSRIFRPYSFMGFLPLMIFEGTIEQFTFFSLQEFKSFFSIGWKHKLTNQFFLLFFFVVLFFAIAGLLWLKLCYRKRVHYMLENSRGKFKDIICSTIDRGLVCFLFGFSHQCLLSSPNLQLLVLGLIELFWILSRAYFVSCKSYENKGPVLVSCVSGLLRMVMQLSIYCFTVAEDEKIRSFLGSEVVHPTVLQLFVAAIIFELLVAAFYIGVEIYISIRFLCCHSQKIKIGQSYTIQKKRIGARVSLKRQVFDKELLKRLNEKSHQVQANKAIRFSFLVTS